jgi:hypothetical protein
VHSMLRFVAKGPFSVHTIQRTCFSADRDASTSSQLIPVNLDEYFDPEHSISQILLTRAEDTAGGRSDRTR